MLSRRKNCNKKAASSAEEVVIMPESAEDPGEVQHEAENGEKSEAAEAEALNAVVSTGQTGAATAAEVAAIFGATAAKVEKAEQQQQQLRDKSGAGAWVATTTRATFNSEVNRLDNSCEINWILDSGCTDHIINNANYYENCIDLKEPINVYLGDKRSVKRERNREKQI